MLLAGLPSAAVYFAVLMLLVFWIGLFVIFTAALIACGLVVACVTAVSLSQQSQQQQLFGRAAFVGHGPCIDAFTFPMLHTVKHSLLRFLALKVSSCRAYSAVYCLPLI